MAEVAAQRLRKLWMHYRAAITIGVGLLMMLLGLGALHQLTREIHLADVRSAFHTISSWQVLVALLLTGTSYLALTFYDVLALRIIGRPLPWRTAALASFTSYTLSHNLGLSPITGGSARYRIYTVAGLDGPDVARIIAIAAMTFWMGVFAVAGLALLFNAQPIALGTVRLPADLAPIMGALALLLIVAAIAVCAFGPRVLSLWGWKVPLPRPWQALAQIGIACVDLAAASTALFVLVPGADPALLPNFVLAYALAIIVALISHVPGGIGVFEATVIALLPADNTALLAGLIAYRVIYYLLPFGCGVTLLALHEGRRWRKPARHALAGAQALGMAITPSLMSAASFGGGAILLLSGSLPASHSRLQLLTAFVPLPFVEASHIAASIAGTGLLLLAPGLYHRLDGAFILTRALLVAGGVFSIIKGIDYEEALVCFAIAGLLQWTRPAFYRRTALTSQPLSPTWLICVGTVLGLALWTGLFAYKHVDYRNALWWQFAWRGDASRFLRGSLGVGMVLAAAALWRLLASSGRVAPQIHTDPADIDRILATATRTDAMLALTGDKRFLLSPARDAFLMYQVHGASWIVMSDPVGPRERWPDLLWAIRASSDAAQGRLLLYQISADTLEIAIELGLQIIKYGEEALVDLTTFSLEGVGMRALRQSARRAAREGATFEICPAGDVPRLLPELKRISDAWLQAKEQKEKGFSLGRFDPGYLARFDFALVRHHGTIVAFANILATANRNELSVDLMRHRDDMPRGTMDFLFAHLMQWGKDKGFQRFSLGLAPLSGIEAHHLSPNWAKVAALAFSHGERMYSFKGLRAYKAKFAPRWEPRYIAGPHGLGLFQSLMALNQLIRSMPAKER